MIQEIIELRRKADLLSSNLLTMQGEWQKAWDALCVARQSIAIVEEFVIKIANQQNQPKPTVEPKSTGLSIKTITLPVYKPIKVAAPTPKHRRPKNTLTSEYHLGIWILKMLKYQGPLHCEACLDAIAREMPLSAEDLKWYEKNGKQTQQVFRKRSMFSRLRLVQLGFLRTGNQPGFWEITEEGMEFMDKDGTVPSLFQKFSKLRKLINSQAEMPSTWVDEAP